MQEKQITSEEVERLDKLKSAKLETDEDIITLAEIFDEDSEIEERSESGPEPEQSLEFLTGGERYIQD